MTKLRLLALLAVVALVLFPAIAFAAGPAFPCAFHGTVLVNGQNVPDGTTITITVGNGSYSTTTTTEAGVSRYGYTVNPATSYADGTAVTFKISGTTVAQSTWTEGANKEVDLSSGTPIIPGGGGITSVVVTSLPAGSAPTGNITNNVLYLGIPAGSQGTQGIQGIPGIQGPAGKGANNVLGIVGIVLAAIALILVVVVMMRKPQAAPPSPKT